MSPPPPLVLGTLDYLRLAIGCVLLLSLLVELRPVSYLPAVLCRVRSHTPQVVLGTT
jgi:hypothetical protein